MTEIQDGLITLGAKYLNITKGEFRERMETSGKKAIEDWNEMGIERFYNDTDIYIYDLVNFNDEYRIDNILHPIKSSEKLKILDYGGGIGVLSSILAKNHDTYYYDLEGKTKEFAKYLNDNSEYKTTFVDSEEEAFALDINAIICVDVLEHVKDPMTLAKKITEKLPTGGLFLTTGLDFSIGPHIPMHLPENVYYKKEYQKYVLEHFTLAYYHATKNETIYLWVKK